MINKTYEMMIVSKAAIGEKDARDLSNALKDLVNELKGKVLNSNFMGKRRFSYIVASEQEGFYEVLDFEMASPQMAEFRKRLQYVDNLLRYLITAK